MDKETAGARRLPDPVLAELVEVYDLGTVRHLEYLPQGRVNDNYDLMADSGRYVVRRSRERRTAEAIAFEHRLMEYLGGRGFPIPPLLYTRGGASYHVIDGVAYRATRFVVGEKYRPGHRGHLEAVARTLARYHRLVREYEAPESKEGFRPVLANLGDGLLRLPWPGVRWEAAPIAPPAVVDCLAYLHRWLEATHGRLVDGAALGIPRLVIHGSCRSGSFIFQGDQVAAMLDYDIAYPDIRTLDIAIALLDFGLVPPEKTEFDPATARAFLAAYQSVEPLAPSELALVPWYMRARILKRELVRYEHYLSTPKVGREEKLLRSAARLAWLEANEDQLLDVVPV